MNQIEQEIARILLDVGAVTLRPDQPFTWASGIKSPIYCDNRLLMSYPEARRRVREAFCHLIKEKIPNVGLIAGVATGAIAHAAWVSDRLTKPMVYIRAAIKDHGKQNQVEGKVTPGIEAVVIEDLVSTGGSSIAAIEALRNAGAKVDHCFSIFSYGFPEALAQFKKINCQLTPLTNFPTLLQIAKEGRIISAAQEKNLLKFSADPWKWLDK
ncbi:MAG: orotate phosphoribosyltransferase [Deltaproteobacteria bacterium]|nr:orotate phosphoribosyltransferase [Deltaproteobacteria bacterium]